MMYGNGWDNMGSWGWVGMLMMLLFWFGFVALIVWTVSGSRDSRGPVTPAGLTGDRAMTILRERLARGELTVEEFDRARQTLDDGRR